MLDLAFEQEGAGKRWRGGGGGGEGFHEVQVTYNVKYSSCETEDLVETHRCKLVCDTPIVRITHICRGLLYAW